MLNAFSSVYRVGLYIRLSREDDDKVLESESITNQKSLLLQYVKENHLQVYDIYIDDGYSGTNFERPDFQRLLQDIEDKKVNMVLTKDMSRLGRDYIGTGNLIERYFPEHHVRYIALTDNIDTFLDSATNDIAPFKAIMNDMYAKDISKKIKSSLRAKQKEGKWVGGRAPFGYRQDSANKNQLVLCEEQARVVQRIYKMCLDGMSFYKIAKQLTLEGVKTPSQYYSFAWKGNYHSKIGEWHSKTIRDILTNSIYTGDMVQNKRNKINYKVKKVVKNSPQDYIVVPDTHTAIITKDVFYEVQKRIPKNVGRIEKKESHLLDGLLYCGECGHRISIQPRRKKDNRCYTICNYYKTYMKQKLCTMHSNNYDTIEQVILDTLKSYCSQYLDGKKVQQRIFSTVFSSHEEQMQKEKTELEQEVVRIHDILDTLYIDKLSQTIDEEQFARVKEKLEDALHSKQEQLLKLVPVSSDSFCREEQNQRMEKFIHDFLSMKNPCRELIVGLIERVDIYEDKKIDVKVSFFL